MTTKEDFLNRIAPLAQKVQEKYGVPASLVIAQAALETGWGEAVKGNNYFGIKTGSQWKGASQQVATHEFVNGQKIAITDHFRAYGSLAESVDNFGKLLVEHARYAGVVNATNVRQAADALQRAGYGTDPQYAGKLKTIIADNHLTRFDDAKYHGYEAGDDFETERKRLQEKRTSDPMPWDNFFSDFVSMLKQLVQVLFGSPNVAQDNIAVDHNAITPPATQTTNGPSRTKA